MSKGIKFRNKNNEHIYPCPYMPVGSIFKSTSNTNPSTYFDGTWVLVHSGYERQQIGSQVIYPDISGSGNVSKTNLIGAYTYETISGIFDNISIPAWCHKEYRITFQARTGGDNKITIFLNPFAVPIPDRS